MSNIVIKMKDGTVRHFPHTGRPGGSYTKRLEYQPGFVVVIDEWDKRTSIPSENIKEIEETPHRGWYDRDGSDRLLTIRDRLGLVLRGDSPEA